MKTRFLLFTLLFGSAASAQVLVQPVTGVHTIRVEDNVTLKVYPGDKTQLEVSNNLAVAQISNGVMSMEGNTSAVLRLNPADGIVNFSAEDGSSIVFFGGSFDFGNQKITISAEDNARVEMEQSYEDFGFPNAIAAFGIFIFLPVFRADDAMTHCLGEAKRAKRK